MRCVSCGQERPSVESEHCRQADGDVEFTDVRILPSDRAPPTKLRWWIAERLKSGFFAVSCSRTAARHSALRVVHGAWAVSFGLAAGFGVVFQSEQYWPPRVASRGTVDTVPEHFIADVVAATCCSRAAAETALRAADMSVHRALVTLTSTWGGGGTPLARSVSAESTGGHGGDCGGGSSTTLGAGASDGSASEGKAGDVEATGVEGVYLAWCFDALRVRPVL